MNLDLYKHIYFVGIGGIGMSALARYFNAKGINVCGYDKVESDLCKELESEGINIHYRVGVDNIPSPIKEYPLTHFLDIISVDSYTVKETDSVGPCEGIYTPMIVFSPPDKFF